MYYYFDTDLMPMLLLRDRFDVLIKFLLIDLEHSQSFSHPSFSFQKQKNYYYIYNIKYYSCNVQKWYFRIHIQIDSTTFRFEVLPGVV